jgi:hypothetical protein
LLIFSHFSKGKKVALAILKRYHGFFSDSARDEARVNRLLLTLGVFPENDLSYFTWSTYRDFSKIVNGDGLGFRETLDFLCKVRKFTFFENFEFKNFYSPISSFSCPQIAWEKRN